MTERVSTIVLAAFVLALSVLFAALTIADAAEHAPTAGALVHLLP